MTIITNENGNALWFILLSVVLLGGLTAIISKGGSSSSQSGDFEKLKIKATTLLRYTKSVERAVQNMQLRGISESDLDFVAIDAGHDNTDCTTTDCQIFHSAGGGVPYRTIADVISDTSFSNDWIISAENRVGGLGCDDHTAGCTDLIMIAPGIAQDLCLAINKLQDITNPSGAAPQQKTFETGTKFTGSITAGDIESIIGGTDATDESPQVERKSAGCIYEFGGGSNTHYFYQVLLPR